MELKKFVVKKSQWLRGEAGNSFLLRTCDRKMCCLGFASLACGLEENDIEGYLSPCDVERRLLNKYPEYFIKNNINSVPIVEIMKINDNVSISDNERILKLTECFTKLGIQISFEE